MNDNRMNKGEDIRKKISNQSAGSSDDKAADILNNAAFKNADLIKKPSSNTTDTANTTDTGNSSELPKDGLEDNTSKSSLGSLKDKAGEAAAVGGALASGNYGKAFFEFFKRHKKLCISVIGGGLIFLLLILAIPIIVASIGGTVIEFFSGIGDAIVGFFSPDEQERMNDYYKELDEVKKDYYTRLGICIDENLITATLTVDIDAQNYANEIGSEPGSDVIGGEGEGSDDVPEIPEKDWDKMKKEVGILASMQIKRTIYGHSKEYYNDKKCLPKDSEPYDEPVTEENLDDLKAADWWHSFIKFVTIDKEEKYLSNNADLVSRHDLNAFQKFFTKKINEEKNYEYRIYIPVEEEICRTDSRGNTVCSMECQYDKLPQSRDDADDGTPTLSIGDLNTMEDAVYYWNLVNSFIPNYYDEFLPSEEGEQRDNAIKKIAEDIYLLYKDLGPGEVCSSQYLANGNYNYACVTKSTSTPANSSTSSATANTVDTSNTYVQMLQCSDGELDSPIEGELIPVEKYVTGVVWAENGGSNNMEALKAQAVAARTYLMTKYKSHGSVETVDGKTVLKMRNCTDDQVYCDPEKGCSYYDVNKKDTSKTVYSGHISGNYYHKDPAPSRVFDAVNATVGEIMYDADGKILKVSYSSSTQSKWNASTSDYLTILGGTYGNLGSVDSECIGTSGDWANWKQMWIFGTNPLQKQPWADVMLGGRTLGDVGCYITSIAILIAKSGTRIEQLPVFDPGTFAYYLNEKGSFGSGGGCNTLEHIPEIAPGFNTSPEEHSVANGDFHDAQGAEQLARIVANMISNGKYVQLHLVDPIKADYTHFVAVDKVVGNKIYIHDPGSSCTVLNECYEGKRINSSRGIRAYSIN